MRYIDLGAPETDPARSQSESERGHQRPQQTRPSAPKSQKVLTYDKNSGRLVSRDQDRARQDPDALVVDQIAQEGFYGKPGVVYLDGGQAESMGNILLSDPLLGAAFAQDSFTVFHAFSQHPPWTPVGVPIACWFIAAEPIAACKGLADREWRHRCLNSMQERLGRCRAMVVFVSAQCVSKTRSYYWTGQRWHGCRTAWFSTPDQLGVRSVGVLTRESLYDQTVLYVGTGSGNSQAAITLAQAGLRRSILVDCERLEPGNVVRHACGMADVGRYKVHALADAIRARNPEALVETHVFDINQQPARLLELTGRSALALVGTDTERSINNAHQAALETGCTGIFARVISRAAGGDVMVVRPGQGPCRHCLFGGRELEPAQISSLRQARDTLPDYTSEDELLAAVQPGLAADIAPIPNLVVKLAFLELTTGKCPALDTLREDLNANFYVWANRRERCYQGLAPMHDRFDQPAILRWYGLRVERDPKCLVCRDIQAAQEVLSSAA